MSVLSVWHVRTMSVRCPYDARTMSVRCPYDVRTMSVRCLYDVRTMSVRCPVVCPRYVRGMSVVCPVRCPYDVRTMSVPYPAIYYTSRALSRFFFFSAVLSSPDFKCLNSKKLNVRCPYDVRHVRGMSVVSPPPHSMGGVSLRAPPGGDWTAVG